MLSWRSRDDRYWVFFPGWIAWIGIGVPDSKYLCGMHNAKDIHLLNFVWIFESFNEEIQPDWSWKSSPHNSCRICRSLVWLGRYTHTIAMRDGGPQESAHIQLVREGSSHAREMNSMKTHLRTVGKKPNEVFGTTYRSMGLKVKLHVCFLLLCLGLGPPLSLANVSFFLLAGLGRCE